MEDTNKKNIEAIVQSGEVFTREFFAEARRNEWTKVSEKDRKAHGKMLAESRRLKRLKKFSTSELAD